MADLRELYLSLKPDETPRTYAELSSSLNMSKGQIAYALRKMGIIVGRQGWQNRKLSTDDLATIVRLYTERRADGTWMGSTLIAKKFNVTPSLINYHLHEAGIQLRDSKESHAYGKACKPVKNLPTGDAPLCQCGCGLRVQWNRRSNRWNIFFLKHQFGGSKPYHNETWLRTEYYEKSRTFQEIAQGCGVNPGSVILYARRFGMILRSTSETLLLRGSVSREKNPAWKGGTSPERARLYNEGHWRTFVKQVYARDSYTCRRCNAPKKGSRSLHAHHIKPWATNPALRFDLTNMITVCRPCHHWIHSPQNVAKDFLA